MKQILPLVSILFTACTMTTNNIAHFTVTDCDTTTNIASDFYQHTNGGWIANHPIPDDKPRLGSFDILHEETQEKLRELVFEAQAKNAPAGTPAQHIGDLFALGMDTTKRDEQGLATLTPYLALAQKANYNDDPQAFATTVARFHREVANVFFVFGATPDYENSTVNIAELWQAGIGLPDRDYYLDLSERGQQIIGGYVSMLAGFLEMVGGDNATDRAEKIFYFEKELAEAMNTKVQNRDPQAVCNKTARENLSEAMPGFDWDAYLGEMGVSPNHINVSQPRYFAQVMSIVAKANPATVRDYLTVKTLASFASQTTSELYQVYFDFYSRQLSGVTAMQPLWKRVLGTLNATLGEEIGKLFVEKHFPPSAKERMLELVEQLRISFGQRINALTWMSDSTKVAAQDKLDAITVKIGYPDKWEDYSSLTIDPSQSYAQNLITISQFLHRREMEKINMPVDKDEWHMTPQTVNAYYNPMANEIVFPAAILQPPFFYADGDDAVNYGAIGVVIGHEMTHGFDDQGSQFDKTGNLSNWWTATDHEKFTSITSQLVEHFNNIEVVDGEKCNGELTLGENIADLGGLNISHQAFRNTLANSDEPLPIEGHTAEQRFLLAYSRIWACSIRNEALHKQLKTDPHAPARLRVNGQLPLVDFFYDAFKVEPGTPMYIAPEKRITIW